MRRFRSPLTRLHELRKQQVRLAELTAKTCLREHLLAQQAVQQTLAMRQKLHDEVAQNLAEAGSVAAHLAGIAALQRQDGILAQLRESESAAASRLADALASLQQAHADEQLMNQLYQKQLEGHRQQMRRIEEHNLLETALALQVSDSLPAHDAAVAEDPLS